MKLLWKYAIPQVILLITYLCFSYFKAKGLSLEYMFLLLAAAVILVPVLYKFLGKLWNL